MKSYWKLFVGLLLIVFAVLIVWKGYMPAKTEYETKVEQLNTSIQTLQATVSKQVDYSEVLDKIPAAEAEMAEIRAKLYGKFPKEMKEEDQIMYILYLEDIFGTEIQFAFGVLGDIIQLSDGAVLQALNLTFNYECGYSEFMDMINYLATDEKVTSVNYATIEYDAEQDIAIGTVTITRYLLNSTLTEYTKPDVFTPETGKENIFEETDK